MINEAFNPERKAVFFTGSPGSGKSLMAKLVASGLGFKHTDADTIFEHMMHDRGLSFKMPDHEEDERDILRSEAGELMSAMREMHVDLGLGIAIDMTGADRSRVRDIKDWLEQSGYDCRMIFIQVDLEKAKDRNLNRERSVPNNVVIDRWQAAQANINFYERLFGKDFVILQNNEDGVTTNSPNVLSAFRWLMKWVSPNHRKISESIESDKNMANLTNKAYFLISKWVEKDLNSIPSMSEDILGNGEEKVFEYYPAIRIRYDETITEELKNLFSNLIIAFVPDVASFYTYAHLPIRGLTHIVALKMTPQEFVYSVKGRIVFRHEFTHFLDELRLKNPKYQAGYDPFPAEYTREWRENYYSNPTEFNAIFHDVSDPITGFLHDAEHLSDQDMYEIKEFYLEKDFKTFIDKERKKQNSRLSKFLTYANEDYKRKMLKRLAVLYNAAEEKVKHVN